LRIQVTQGKNRIIGRSLTHFSYCFLQHGRISMKDFEIRVKNLSTHRFPLGTDPAKECFILNVAAHKHFTAVPGFRRLPLESSVSYDKGISV
jgi:hypothetical protein